MRGFRGGIGGLAGYSAGVMMAQLAGFLDFRVHRLPEGGKVPMRQFKKPFAKSKGMRTRSFQRGSRDRLILDRSSSVRKLQRFHNNGTIIPATGRKD